MAIATNPAGGTLSGTVTRNAVNGIASFTDLSLDQAGAGYTLTAAASGLVSVTSAQFTITAAAGRLVFSVQPTTTTAGAAMSPAIRVVVQDGSGNVLTSATPPITIAIGTNAGGGTLTGTVSQNAVNGVATFTDLSLDKVGSGYTLTATASGYTGATSAGFGVTPAAPVRLTFTQQPSNTMARAAISPAMLVAIQDAFGNTVTNANAVVNVSLGTNPGGGTLAGTLSTSTVNGVATFSDLSIDKTGIGYTLTAAASGLTSAASAGFRITPGPAAQLVFSAQPSTTAAGVVISPSVQVTIQDAFGNVVTSATTPVMMAIATNPAGGTLSGTVTRNAVNGIATFSDLSIDKVGTGYTLAATASGLPVATSAAFSITPGAVARLTFTVEPSRTPVATTITPAVQVTAQDAFGNTVTSYAGAVSLAITPGTGKANAALGGTLTVSASGGIARFSNLTIDRAGTAYTLTATANGLTADTSAAFDITNPALLRFVVQPTSTTQNSVITPAVQVAVQDAFGNIVRGYTGSVAIALTSSPSGVTLRGTTTVGVVNGIATFSDLSINKTGTGFQLTASDPLGALTAATSVPFDIR
ncbi:MAG TPA: hypothetical protein VE714_01185, partial [Gemmatimonadales bacterium]|nr:hypothetical protein [Gemmatimonadales bacterium]